MMEDHQLLTVLILGILSTATSQKTPVFSLTVAAQDRKVEVTFKDLPISKGAAIILTSANPKNCKYNEPKSKWICANNNILYTFEPSRSSVYHKTSIIYKYTKATQFNKASKCDSVWAIYVDRSGKVMISTCLMLYPRWINELLPTIGKKRIRDLVIPGTHNSGCYKETFKVPLAKLYTSRYSLTQDDTILGQLYQGTRFLDIRPAYIQFMPYEWYVSHGVIMQQPLELVMKQVIQFINETEELVIFAVKEFPMGFFGNYTHRKLVKYITGYFKNRIIKPKKKNPWKTNLSDLMAKPNERIILAYDNEHMWKEFSDLLFPTIRQNWGNVRHWKDLQAYLKKISLKDPQLMFFLFDNQRI